MTMKQNWSTGAESWTHGGKSRPWDDEGASFLVAW